MAGRQGYGLIIIRPDGAKMERRDGPELTEEELRQRVGGTARARIGLEAGWVTPGAAEKLALIISEQRKAGRQAINHAANWLIPADSRVIVRGTAALVGIKAGRPAAIPAKDCERILRAWWGTGRDDAGIL